MIKILKIAKLEISILFYSPVAWLVLAIFMVQAGTGFFGMLGSFQELFMMGEKANNLTQLLFPGINGLFDKVLQTLYLYIPLLTMGLMSREFSSGSIKLLLSSPVKIREIILGKYLAMLYYALMLMAILGIYSLIGIMIIKDADVGLICAGLLSLFLLTATYAAIGLFMSSLTGYQVVAAISTLAVFAALKYVGGIGQSIDFVRDLTYFLSLSGRTENMLSGLITSGDVIYYLLIISLFLGLTILRLKAGREAKALTVQIGKYVALITVVLFCGYISSRPLNILYWDATAQKSRTLTPASQEIARQINGPLKITTYVNLLDQHVYAGLPVSRNTDLSRFEDFRRFIPGIKMNYVYYYDATDLANNPNMIYQGDIKGLSVKQIAEKVADNLQVDVGGFLPPNKIRKMIDLSAEGNTFIRRLSYHGKTSYLRLYNENNQFPEEAEITAAIKKLIRPNQLIVFINGDDERSITLKGDRSYQLFSNARKTRKSLINQGFDVSSVDLNNADVPKETTVLVLADAAKPLSNPAIQRIQRYLDAGGNMLIAAEPQHRLVINPVLLQLGVQLSAGMLVNADKKAQPDLVSAKFTGKDNTYFEQMTGPYARVALPSAAMLIAEPKGFVVDTLLKSNADGWNRIKEFDPSSTSVSYEPQQGDEKGSKPLMITLTREKGNKVQKVLISGDADFMSDNLIGQAYNFPFINGIFRWFSDGGFPVKVSRPIPKDDAIMANRKQLSVYRSVTLWGLPALIVAGGAALLLTRKRK
ncbi:Gldg family protein [Mucilaginibacter sp. ZT4R22]|uniref:Gldg family protein n=1 Tax=Mucilaginibacter pankratovii TaxID=2772110 RepID=A0ABR7WK29_9SPHI|nr:Gldg family protein [Mucilaginibacter pankratovii]MBD1362678.1 Gldg family protein [Mucilaginibacter pankratovii]